MLALGALATGYASDNQNNAEDHFRRAATLAQLQKTAEAENEYTIGLKASPNAVDAWNNLAVLYFGEKRFERAVDAFGRAHRLQPWNAEIAFNLGLSLYSAGQLSAAIPLLEEGVSSKHSKEVPGLLAACYLGTRQWAAAIQKLELIRDSTQEGRILFMLVKAYRHASRPQDSLDAAAQLLRSYPDSIWTHQMLGEAYDKDGDEAHAAQEFEAAIAVAPTAPQVHFMLGYLRWRWKHYGQASGPLAEETRLNPGFVQPYYYLADIASRNEETAHTIDLLGKALEIDPSYTDARVALGKVLLKVGRVEESVRTLTLAEAGPENVQVHYLLGRALIEAGRVQEGKLQLAKVKQLSEVAHKKSEDVLNGLPVADQVP